MNLLHSISKTRHFNEDESVFQIGQPATHIFQVITGEVHLSRHSGEGQRVLLFRAYAGDYFAEASLNSSTYHCTAVAKTLSSIRLFNADEVRLLLQENSEFAMAWISRLSTELRRQRASVERLNLKPAADRVIHYLLTEGQPMGEVELTGTLSELSEILGMSRETLYRTLAQMQKSGSIERIGNKLRIIQG
ncbi:MAG: Crp/Fnr family transcriptional regulator [Sedimenticola sp.]|nr:Crp/Fnr family transcriptional regulator [Sedimenticola sp.]